MFNSNTKKLTITNEKMFEKYFCDMLNTIFNARFFNNKLTFFNGEQFVIETYLKNRYER